MLLQFIGFVRKLKEISPKKFTRNSEPKLRHGVKLKDVGAFRLRLTPDLSARLLPLPPRFASEEGGPIL